MFGIPAYLILSRKNRGGWFYLIPFLMPLIGLIVAIFVKRKPTDEAVNNNDGNQDKTSSVNPYDITAK